MTSREQFETWAEEAGALPWGYLKKQRTQNGGYSVQIYNYMWAAWQASREAVEVELPPQVDCCNVPFAAHSWNACLEESEKRIRAAGIKVKGE